MESILFRVVESVAILFLALMLFRAILEPGLPYTFAQRPSEPLDATASIWRPTPRAPFLEKGDVLPRFVPGDFNEWAPGLASRLLRARLKSVDIRTHLRRRRAHQGMMPIFRDHIYFDDALILHRTPTALLSDHRCSSLISAGTIARSA